MTVYVIFYVVLIFCNVFNYGYGFTCKKRYNQNFGYVSSTRGETCDHRIEAKGKDWIYLKFTTFNIDGDMPYCDKDRVEIWTGCVDDASSRYQTYKVATFCSNKMVSSTPHDIYGQYECIIVRQIVTGSQNKTGSTSYFKLQYSSGTGKAPGIWSSCRDRDMLTSSGIIASPRWPQQFKRSDFPSFDQDCDWDIETSQSNSIQINAMDVDFSGGGGYCSLKNYLKIKGKKSLVKHSSLSSSYCSRRKPFTLNTKFYEVDVELKGYYTPRGSERGFVLGYVVYRDDEAHTAMKWYTILGVVVVIIFVAIFAFCIFRRWRARRARSSTTNVVSYGSGTNNATSAPTVPLVTNNAYPQQPMEKVPPQGYPAPLHQGYQTAPPPQVYPGAPPPQVYPGAPPPQGYPGIPPQPYPAAPPPYSADGAPYPPPPMAQPYPAAPYPPPS